jgi:hypothetical protein
VDRRRAATRELDGRDAEIWREVAFMWRRLAGEGGEVEPWLRDACASAHEAAVAYRFDGPRALIREIRRAEERLWTRAD